MSSRLAYYDRDADIVWLPVGDPSDVIGEEMAWGLVERNAASRKVVAIEVWSASTRLPAEVLAVLPEPPKELGTADAI